MKKIEEIRNILHNHFPVLKKKFGITKLLIFGSIISGKQQAGSDVDILVELERETSLLGIVEVEQYLSDLLEESVDLIPVEDLRDEIRESVMDEAITV